VVHARGVRRKRLAGPGENERPPGATRRLAAQLRERWRRAGLVVVESGSRRAKVIRRAESEGSVA